MTPTPDTQVFINIQTEFINTRKKRSYIIFMIEDLKILLTELEIINDAQINSESYENNDKYRIAQTLFNTLTGEKIKEINNLIKDLEEEYYNKED